MVHMSILFVVILYTAYRISDLNVSIKISGL